MSPLPLDRVRRLLPDLDELRPLQALATERSTPDPERTWSASGEVAGMGDRLVDVAAMAAEAGAAAAAEGRRLEELYARVARALERVEAGDGAGAAEVLLDVARTEEAADRPERAEAWALAAADLVKDLKDRRPASLALRRAARAARAQGKLPDAELRYREAHRLARDSFDARGAAEAAVGMGNVLEQQGAWSDAETWYRRALQVLEDVEGPLPERWHALLNVHIALRSRGRLDESEAWLERAEAEAAALDDPDSTVFLQNARGQLHMARGDHAGAEAPLRRALEAARSAGAAVVVQLNLAEALLAQDRVLEATEEARDAERQALTGRVFPRLPEVYRLLGRIAAREGHPEAFVLFEEGLALIRARKLPPLEEAMTLQARAAVERDRGDVEAARGLEAAADALYRELGIERPRDEWSDTFGRTRTETPEETDHGS